MSKISLNDIKKPIESELKEFESHFRKSVESTVPLLDKIMHYIVQRKGKQVRPILIFLCAKMFGDINKATHDAASLVELLHTASLVHDDVIDDSNERRGFFSINALWKNKIAVIVGDYLLSKGLLLAVENERYALLQIVSKAVKDLSEGELLQMEKARKLDIKEDIYYEIIRQKTASLIKAACKAGATSVTQNKDQLNKVADFGENIGMAVQLKDDLFDFGDDVIGKPKGIDIKEKKMTLPLIYALNKADNKTKKKFLNYIKRDSENPRKVKEIIEYVRGSGGMEYAHDKMMEYRKKAEDILSTLPENEPRAALFDLVAFVTERKK